MDGTMAGVVVMGVVGVTAGVMAMAREARIAVVIDN